MSKIKRPSSGFTIVEILVAIAVAGVVVISLSYTTTSYIALSQRGRYLNLANSYVEAKVEALRNGGFNALAPGTTSLTSELPSRLPPGKTATMTVSTPITGIKQVDITVFYKDQGLTKSYSYKTYLGELGVGQ